MFNETVLNSFSCKRISINVLWIVVKRKDIEHMIVFPLLKAVSGRNGANFNLCGHSKLPFRVFDLFLSATKSFSRLKIRLSSSKPSYKAF